MAGEAPGGGRFCERLLGSFCALVLVGNVQAPLAQEVLLFDVNTFVLRASFAAISALALACSSDPSGGRMLAGAGGSGAAGSAGSGEAGTSIGGASGPNAAGAGASAGSGGVSGPAGAGASDDLQVHIEDQAQLEVEIVTVSCPGECVEVKAVARGGQPDYHFMWEDGTTSATRMLCPEQDSTHEVTVTDTARVSEEFGHAMETASASVGAHVLECEPPTEPVDAGAGDECSGSSDCGTGQTCFEGVCVGEGGLRFSLTWNEDTDFDLFVRMPDGTQISYVFPNRAGGMLDVDDCFESCRIEGGPHVENIFFEEPPHGTYTYWIVNSGAVTPDAYRLEVSADGMVQATQAGMIAAFAPASMRYTFDY